MDEGTPSTKTPAVILAAKARDYRGWRLLTTCIQCYRKQFVAIAELPDQFMDLSILEILARLRCSGAGCGAKPAAVEIRHFMASYHLLGPER
jgi:hypothetical protein